MTWQIPWMDGFGSVGLKNSLSNLDGSLWERETDVPSTQAMDLELEEQKERGRRWRSSRPSEDEDGRRGAWNPPFQGPKAMLRIEPPHENAVPVTLGRGHAKAPIAYVPGQRPCRWKPDDPNMQCSPVRGTPAKEHAKKTRNKSIKMQYLNLLPTRHIL